MAKTKVGLPFETLEDKVLFYPRFRARKNGVTNLIDAYAFDAINDMTNLELLQAISQALAEEEDDDVEQVLPNQDGT